VVQLHHQIDRIHAAGAELVVVGNGTPNFVAGFRELTGFRGPLYCDPTLAAYRAAGLRRGVMRILNPLSGAYAVRAMVRGNFQGRTQGDATQQGGVLVITPPDRIVFEHISKVAGDNAPAAEVVAALEHAVAPPPRVSAQP
jgi:alkyl-hydroperoxide reductase/thiol specific antioxidant family protein